ncbi:MAG: prolipoprotein diacylglyceryl transferase [Pseudomonadota bacterium]
MLAAIPFPDLSPEIFTISLFGFDFALRWYAVSYIVGFALGWWIVRDTMKRPALWPDNKPILTVQQVEDLLTWIIVGVILGGRLGYVIFYQPGYYLQNPLEIPAIWTGGMSFHGGLLGVTVACILFARKNGAPWLSLADVLCMVFPVGLLLGRLANFNNAELWGRATDVPWGVIFPGDAAQFCPGVEGLCARHPSQLYEAALEGLILGAILFYMVYRRGALKRVGAATGVFFMGYGLSRFAVEFVRQPDAHFVAPGNPLGLALQVSETVGLTMGQILTIPMIVLGLYWWWRSRTASTLASP